jgi:hypothetical protein
MKIALVLPHTIEEFGIDGDKDFAQDDGYEHQYARLIMKTGHEPTLYYMSYKKGTAGLSTSLAAR